MTGGRGRTGFLKGPWVGLKPSWLKALLFAIAGTALLAYPFIFKLPFPQHLMIKIFLFATLAQAWNILGGYCGQISLGHAVYFGIGAYTSTLLLIKLSLSPWMGMLTGGVLAVVVSQIIGYPCFRLVGHYFAIATIAVGEIVQTAIINWQWAGGAVGLYVPLLEESLANFQFHSSKVPYYYISLAMTVAVTLTAWCVERSKLGYYFRAIKDDPDAAKSLGINITRYKLIAIAISGFFTAIVGAFYAQYILYIDPESVLPLMLSILICLTAVLGGVGTIWGPIIGALILIPLSEFTRIYFGGRATAIDLVIYGALIVIIAVLQPAGLMGLARKIRGRSE